MRSKLNRKVSAQINVPNRLESILSLKTKESLYRSFLQPNFYHCNHVWHLCGKRNPAKIEKVNEGALRYVYNNKHAYYQHLLERIRLPSMESRRIQDMLLTIHNSIIVSRTKHHRQLGILLIYAHLSTISGAKNMFFSLPKVNTTRYGLKS